MADRDNGRKLLKSIKYVAGTPNLQIRLQVGTPPVAWLRPVATRHEVQSDNDVASLTEWRNKFVKSFLTEFTATKKQTAEWLANTIGPDDSRILFMVENIQYISVGYAGIGFINWESGYGEADAIVRGLEAPKGLMTEALKALLAWAIDNIGLKSFGVRVRSDNPALEFYRKLGFAEQKRVALNSRIEEGKLIWYEDATHGKSDLFLVYHDIDTNKLFVQ